MKTNKKIFLLFILLNILIIISLVYENNIFAGDLVITSGQSYIMNEDEVYNDIVINGTLYINKNNLTITADNLTINSEGRITYTNNYANSTSMYLSLIINNNAEIEGIIDFSGKNGSDGRNGDSSYSSGYDGKNGTYGKNLILNVHNKLIISGKINTSGGNGGDGGYGVDNTVFGDAGSGGDGGNGGNSGDVTIESGEIYLRGSIISNGGDGGDGGDGGHAGWAGTPGDGGYAGVGKNGGEILIQSNYIDITGEIAFESGEGGKGGAGGEGPWGSRGASRDDGNSGSPGLAKVYYGYGINNGIYNPNTVDIKVDKQEPEVLNSNFDIEIINGREFEGEIYTNDITPMLEWTEFIDYWDGDIPSSGLSHYKILMKKNNNVINLWEDSSKNSQLELFLEEGGKEVLDDGKYQVKIKAYDKNNNESKYYPLNSSYEFTIDTDPPSKPYILEETNITTNEATVNWVSSTDNTILKSYSIIHYETRYLDWGWVKIPYTYVFASTTIEDINTTNFPLHSITNMRPNQKILYKIGANDVAGNTSWDYASLVTAPEISNITFNDSGWDSENNRHYLSVKVESVGDKADSYRYIRKKKVINNGQVEYITEFVSDWFSVNTPENNNFVIRDTGGQVVTITSEDDNLAVSNNESGTKNLEPHGTYKCFIETRNSSGEIVKSNATGDFTIKNIIPSEQAFIYPEESIVLNSDNVTFKIKPFADPDNDNLTYNFYLGFDNDNDGIWEDNEYFIIGTVTDYPNNPLSEISVTSDLTEEGKYKWFVEVTDGYMVEAIKSKVYSFNRDITAPEIYYNFYKTGVSEPINAINTRELLIKDLSVSEDTVQVEVKEGNSILYTDNIPPFSDINITISEGEGNKEIVVNAKDEAGNIGILTKNIIYDITPPPVPINLSLTGGKNQLKANWDRVNEDTVDTVSDIKGYKVSYSQVNTGEEFNDIFVPQALEPFFIVDNLDYNEKVNFIVRTIDEAGNLSDKNSAVGYSLAERGNINDISFQEADYYTEYSAVIDLIQVKAYQYKIRRWKREIDKDGNENLVNQKDSDWISINDTQYIDEDLQPHTNYYYSVITSNQSGEIETGAELSKFSFTVPNIEPSEPVINDINYLNTIPAILRTAGSTDPDGDSLEYYFTLIDSSGNILLDNQLANNPDDPDGRSFIVPENIINIDKNGENYTWFVNVFDGHMYDEQGKKKYIQSKKVNSIIDTISPEINIKPEKLSDYVSNLELDVTVTDSLSGLSKIEYYWNQENILPENREIISLDLTEGSQRHQFSITEIPDGRNNLHLKAIDTAGNEYKKTYISKLDTTPPEMSNLTVTGRKIGDDLYTTNSTSISAEWKLKDDYTAIDYFRYAIVTPEELNSLELLPEERFTVVDEYFAKSREDFSQVAIANWLNENNTYYFVVEAFNTVGLSTGLQVSEGVKIDSKAPYIGEIIFNNVNKINNKNYLSNLSDLNISTDIKDNGGSGVKEIKYALVESAEVNDETKWFSSMENLRMSVKPLDGKVYYLAVRALDNLDQVNIRYSSPLIIDQSGPVVEELIAGSKLNIDSHDEIYYIRSGIYIPLSFSISDEVELTKIKYSIGTAAGENNVSLEMYPETEGWVELDRLDEIQQFKIEGNLPEGKYYINLLVENSAGLTTLASSNPISIDNSIAVSPIVLDDGEYTANADELHFSWTFDEASKEVQGYEYKILEVDKENRVNTIINWKRIIPEKEGESFSHIVSNLELISGNTYYIQLRAVYKDGTFSKEFTTDGIIVDTTPPVQAFIDDGVYSTSDRVYLKWGAEDEESGIFGYQIKIGTGPGSGEITDGWISLDKSGKGYLEGLNLDSSPDIVYFTTLKVSNGAGLTWEVSGNGFRVDNTPPPVPIVLDEGRYTSDEPIHLDYDWKWTPTDKESGIKKYQIALLTEREVDGLTKWVDVGQDTNITLDSGLVEGQWYYLAVKSVNRAGLSMIGYSDGILIDTSAPNPPRLEDGGDYVQIDDSGVYRFRGSIYSK